MMAAGTGGHVFPALAVARELQRQGHRVSWLTTPNGMENRLLEKHPDIVRYPIDIQGVRGNGMARKLRAPFKIFNAMLATLRILKQQKIDAVAGFGGYVCGPGGLAARLNGTPLIIHEQNAIAGFTNMQLARVAQRICQAFEGTFQRTPKVVTTGNPVREDICNLPTPALRYAERGETPLNILIVGGSLGAQALNQQLPAALLDLNMPLNITHQCGQAQLELTQQRYAELNQHPQPSVKVVPFIEDMAQAYANADLMICRAGALTVTEVATAGVAAIFIPLPSAVDDHQTANARYLAEHDAAVLCPQSQLKPAYLQQILPPLLNRERLSQMATRARQQAQPDATEYVAAQILALSK